MNPIELRARRAALGLSQAELAALLDCPRPVLSTWETGSRRPRDPLSIEIAIAELEDVMDGLIDDLAQQIEHASGVQDSSVVKRRTYDSDEAWWAVDAEARAARLPSSMHRVALARAAAEARGDGITVRITGAGVDEEVAQ